MSFNIICETLIVLFMVSGISILFRTDPNLGPENLRLRAFFLNALNFINNYDIAFSENKCRNQGNEIEPSDRF